MSQMFGKLLIRSKLSLVLAVPVAVAALLGVAGAAGAWSDRAGARAEARMARVTGLAVAAVHELQEERVRAVAWAAGRGRDGEAELSARRRRVDRALAAYRAGAAGLGPTGDPALDRAVSTAAARLDRLAVQRALVDRRLVPPERAGVDHDTMIAALTGVARGLADRLTAPEPARVTRLLLAVTEAKEATGQERTLLAAAPPGPATVTLAAAAAVARQELGHLRAAAGDRLERIDRTLGLPRVRTVRGLELALLEPVAGPPAARDLAAWRDGLADRSAALRRVEGELAGDLDAAARVWLGRQERRLRDRLALVAAVALATGAAALALRLGPARREARPPGPAWAAVPGLARRAQALADRQLQLLDGLARDEPDPGRRRGLAGVEHLATRLRRAAETLLAITGAGPAGRPARPAPVTALLRAAVAEAEAGAPDQLGPASGTRRVELVADDSVEVDGRAGADLVHLLAELLENAAAFSPPAAPVVVTGAADGDGYRIEVRDRGLGMTGQELARANQRLAGDAEPAGQAAGDRLGLPIVARLAHGHGFEVRLAPSPEGGVTATVRLPATALTTRTPAPAPRG